MADAYNLGIRDALTKKGVANSDIGYNPQTGYVQVGGRDFMKGDRNYAGTNFTSQANFNNAWGQFNAPKGTPTYNPASVSGQYRPSGTNYNPQQAYNQSGYAPQQTQQNTGYTGYTSPANAIDQRISDLYNYLQNQQSFDPYSSSAYKEAEAQAQRAAQANTRAAQESFGSAGFGRSSALGERVAGINNDATEYLLTQVIPQIQAQEEAKRQQQFQNLFSLLAPQQEQQRFAENTAQGRAALTGSFLAPEAQQIINQLTGLKSQTEQNWMSMTPEQREAARMQGDQYRAMLQGMNVDPSLFGADVNSSQAYQNVGKAGQQTLGYRQQAYNEKSDTRDYNRGVYESDREFNYTQGRDKKADQQWMDEFNYRAEQDGIQNALAWAAQNLNERQESRVAANQASRGSSGGGSKKGSSSSSSSKGVIKDVNQPRTAAAMETYIINNLPGGPSVQGPPSPHQLETIESMILDNPNLSDKDIIKLYERFGIPLPE